MLKWLLVGVALFLCFFVAGYAIHDPKRYEGKSFRREMTRGLIIAVILTVIPILLLLIHGSLTDLFKALGLGLTLAVLFCLWLKRWMDKHIDRNRVFLKRSRFRTSLTFSLTMTLIILIGSERIVENVWVLCGLCLSYVIAQVYVLNRVIMLESQLGESIVQEVSNEDSGNRQ